MTTYWATEPKAAEETFQVQVTNSCELYNPQTETLVCKTYFDMKKKLFPKFTFSYPHKVKMQ